MSNPTVDQPVAEPPTPAPAKPKSIIGALFSVGVFIFVIYYFWGGGVENKVATDAVDQYHIAVRNGTPMDRCVHAGLVSAAYIQAKDEANYKEWKAREKADCAAAGVPEE